jgi:hypothetical protein
MTGPTATVTTSELAVLQTTLSTQLLWEQNHWLPKLCLIFAESCLIIILFSGRLCTQLRANGAFPVYVFNLGQKDSHCFNLKHYTRLTRRRPGCNLPGHKLVPRSHSRIWSSIAAILAPGITCKTRMQCPILTNNVLILMQLLRSQKTTAVPHNNSTGHLIQLSTARISLL